MTRRRFPATGPLRWAEIVGVGVWFMWSAVYG
jgi:hypothetical protein